MYFKIHPSTLLITLTLIVSSWTPTASACAAVSFLQVPVVNADQSVIIIWDAATRTEHFIRQASFKSTGDEVGFIVPTPTQPELEEAGDEAFDFLQQLTAPQIKHQWHLHCPGIGCCAPAASLSTVKVLQEREVAGYKAAVLQAGVAGDLVRWLKDNGYAYSPAMEAWAKPYIDQGWKFTALKLAKTEDGKKDRVIKASSLRISFKTDHPLFPYREPDSAKYAESLGISRRLLRIYFIADARYRGDLTPDSPWTGKVAWANKLGSADRLKALELLKLPAHTGPVDWWLTEFEDNWPYQKAPSDLYFQRDARQTTVKRDAIVVQATSLWPGDVTMFALAATFVTPLVLRRVRRTKTKLREGKANG